MADPIRADDTLTGQGQQRSGTRGGASRVPKVRDGRVVGGMVNKRPIVVYFDTNVVRDLAERRGSNASKKVGIILGLNKKDKIAVAPSFEVLYEVLSSPDLSGADRIRNGQFYDSIVNWKYALKASDWMIHDDIVSLARNGGPSSPYCAIDEEQSGFIKSLRSGNSILPGDDWEQVVKEAHCQNKQFVNNVFNNYVRELDENSKTELRNCPRKTWEEWWTYGGLAEIIASALDRTGDVVGKQSLLVLPSVRAAVGYILHNWLQQIVNKAELRPTTHHDFRNAVLAGGVGKIVTGDKKLRNAINHVPGLNVKAWTLDGFIREVAFSR